MQSKESDETALAENARATTERLRTEGRLKPFPEDLMRRIEKVRAVRQRAVPTTNTKGPK